MVEVEENDHSETRSLAEEIVNVPSPYELYDISKAIEGIIKNDHLRSRSTRWLEDINSEILRTAATAIIHRDFQAFDWKDSLEAIYDSVRKEAPLPLNPEYFRDNLDLIRKKVSRAMMHEHRIRRRQTENERLHRAMILRGALIRGDSGPRRSGGPLTRFFKLLSPFEMSRPKRKEIYREFEEKVIEQRKKGNQDHARKHPSVVSKYKGLVRYQVGKAFKASRMVVREKIAQTGLNPDHVFNQLDLLNGTAGNFSTSMMKRLNVLSGVLREKRTSLEAREAISDMLMRYTSEKNTGKKTGPVSSTPPVERPTASISNVKKTEKREERRRRRDEWARLERERRPEPAPSRPRVSVTLPEMVSYMNTSERVTLEDVVALKRMVKNVKITPENRPIVLSALRHLLLAERAPFGLHGRLEERALRNRAIPQNRYGEFSTVLHGLMREGVFAYEHHLDRSDFIALVGTNRNAILAKYGHKKNQ
jgi:hypothetical protein